MKVSLVLACAGKGSRAGFEKNKLLVKYGDKTVLEKTLSKFVLSGLIDEYIVVASKEDFSFIKTLLPKEVKTIIGGHTRTDSVKNALELVNGDIVLIHDGARPFVDSRIIKDCIDSANKNGSGITAVKNQDTIIKLDNENTYVGKDNLYLVQTPQAFKTDLIKKAYSLAGNNSFNDDGEVYQKYIGEISLVNGDKKNVKLTYPEDFELLLKQKEVRVGSGFDCHRLVENRKLILGGVEIPHDKGLLGHSDADVLTHAVMDAMLSSVAERDIGYHFPDNYEKYKDADSMKLLSSVKEILKNKGYKVNNVSAVIMAEKPKLLKLIPVITESLANALDLDCKDVGIGATTLEGLGFVGREEAISVHATVTVKKI